MTDVISAERLSCLIGLIYDSAIDAEQWPFAMEAIRIELGFHNATLDLIRLPSGEALTSVTCNIPSHYLSVIANAGPVVVEQWGGERRLRTLPLSEPAVLSHVNPAFDPDTSTNGYYIAFAKPQGLIDVLSIGLARDGGAIGTMSFGRHRDAGPVGEREIKIARLLVPHLQRAATINRMLEGSAQAQANLTATLDALTVPVFLVDAARLVLHANAAGDALVDAGGLVHFKGGRLQAYTSGATSALAVAVTQAALEECVVGRRGLGIPVTSAHGDRGALYVLPLCRGRRRNEMAAVAAVFVAQVDAPFVPPGDVAAALFDLTPAETRLFDLLVTGHSPASAASVLGVESSTIKSHRTRIYEKTGVHRQADLVRVALSLTVPIIG